MESLREQPADTSLTRTGWKEGRDPMPYDCPCCGASLCREEMLYRSAAGEILGCGNCVYGISAEDVFEEALP